MLGALKRTCIQITANVLFERNAQAVAIQRPAFLNVAIDGSETCNEQNFCAHSRHLRRALRHPEFRTANIALDTLRAHDATVWVAPMTRRLPRGTPLRPRQPVIPCAALAMDRSSSPGARAATPRQLSCRPRQLPPWRSQRDRAGSTGKACS